MGNRVSPSQPEKNIEQVQGSPSNQVGKPTYKHAGEQPSKVKPTVERDTTKWILKNINATACLCNEESDKKNMCHFGKNQEKNVSNVEKQQNESDTERTNYFGEIRFGRNCTAKYIRVHSTTTEPDTVLTLMNEKWKLGIPNLLIYVHDSMNGIAKKCQTSLTKAVQGTGAWIITDGKHKYVNTDETADEQHIIIGISQWGAIHNKHQMDNQQRTSPAETYTEKTSLDQHHSHFILIDDRSGDTLSTTSNFRKELESESTKFKSDNGVPTVRLVFEGDNDSKRTVYDAPESNIPVVIVKTSDQKASGTEKQSDITEDISTSKVTHICEWNEDSCDSDLGLAILQALLKDAKNKDKTTSHQYNLKLFEIAKNISIDTILQQVQSHDDFMMTAIFKDRVEFVELLLQNGFDLKTFLIQKRKEKSYSNIPATNVFKKTLTEIITMRKTKVCEGKDKIEKDSEGNDKNEKEFSLEEVVKDLVQYLYGDSGLQCTRYVNRVKEDTKHTTKRKVADLSDQTQPDDDDPYQELLILSVLNHCQNVAKCFWRRGKDGMPAVLFAHALLSAMSHQSYDRDFKEKCKKHRGEFTNLAIGILNEGYTKGGVNLAKKLLIHQHEKTSCVLIAVNAKNKQFISAHACQTVFNDIWMGNINQETGILCNNLKLLLCIFFPFLILRLIQFKTDPNSTQPNEKKKAKGKEPTIWKKIKYFYQAPVVKCFHNVISYMLFLGLYSYILMTKFDRYMSWQEIVLCVWVFTIFTQEVIQVHSTPSKGWKRKLSNYVKDVWNILDIVTLFLFLCGMILRIFDNKHVAESAHVVHGVNLITFYLRLLHIFSVHRELGPKLVMIIHMVYNTAYFLMILVVFIVAYGIASHSILYPHTEPSFETFTEIFRRPYWNIYGELMLDKFEGSADCTNDPELYKTGTYSRCPTESGKYFVPLLLAVYMLMCNILLLNLLIAMFSSTYQKVQENSDLYWCFQQYSLINEYANRPVLVPPVIIFKHLYQLIQWIRNCYKKKTCKYDADIKTAFCTSDVFLCDKEKKMVRDYKNGLEHISSNVSEADSANLEKKMEQMEKQLNRLEQMQRKILEKLGSSKDLNL